MTKTKEVISPAQLEQLRRMALYGQLMRTVQTLWVSSIEPDKRKIGKFVRTLLQDNKITSSDDKYLINSDAFIAEIQAEPVNLREKWNQLRAKNDRRRQPFVRFSEVSCGEWKTLMEPGSLTQFYVVSTDPFNYSCYDFTDKPGYFEMGSSSRRNWWGPFPSLTLARIQYDKVTKTDSGRAAYEIVFSDHNLVIHVAQVLFEEKLDNLYSFNALWGLEQLGIATEDELYEPPVDGEKRRQPRVSQTLLDIGFLGMGQTGKKTTDWEHNLADSVHYHRKRIIDSQRKLELLTRIDLGVLKYGGWAKFAADYRKALSVALIAEESKENSECQSSE